MDLPYFYEENIKAPDHNLSEQTSSHCIQVLRMKPGEQLQLTDGRGNLFTATIISANKKKCEVKIEETRNEKQVGVNIFIAISLLKNSSRLEWFIEKATEIGVREIVPLICDHTEKENFRRDRMNNILISAMLQSRQTWLPQMHQPVLFSEYIRQPFNGLKLIAHCAGEEKKLIPEIINNLKAGLILIGPEGDFSKTEIDAAIRNEFIAVSLGNTRLRTETAGIVAAVLLKNALSNK